MKIIRALEAILKSKTRMLEVIGEEVLQLKETHATPRRTQVIPNGVKDFSMEDVIPDAPTVVMITREGYIKRLDPDTFKTQARGGKGVSGLTTKEEDVVEQLFSTTTHKDLFFFTTRGRVFQLKAYEVPEASRTAKGQALVNFLQLAPGEGVSAALSMDDLEGAKHLMMVTARGQVKKTELSEFEHVRRSGLIAIKLKNGDSLNWVKPTSGNGDIMLVTQDGQSIRFSEKEVRPMGRVAAGVRGIKLRGNDVVISMDVLDGEDFDKKKRYHLLVVTVNGYGKRTDVIEYKVQGRGGSGIKTANVTTKTGPVVDARLVNAKDERDLFVISSAGQVIRLPLVSVSVLGRATQGVRVMRFKKAGDSIASVTVV